MSEDLRNICEDDEKKIKDTTGPLARLFRQILIDNNVDWAKMNGLLNGYVNDPRNRIPGDRKSRSSERGNMVKEISRPDMTFKVFFKGIRLLAPIKARFEIHMTWGAGKKTITGFNIPLNEEAD